MSGRTKALAKRRAELAQRSASQRASLARRLRGFDRRLQAADDGIAVMRRYVVTPLVAVLAVAALLLLRRPGFGPWLRAALLFSAGRRVIGAPGRQGDTITRRSHKDAL